MRALRSLPIRVQLTIILVLLVLSLTGTLAIVSYRAAVDSLKDEGEASLQALAATREDTLNVAIRNKRDRLVSAIQAVVLGCDVMGRVERWCARDSLRPFFDREQIIGATLSTRRGTVFSFGQFSRVTSPIQSPADVARDTTGRPLLVLTYSDAESGLTLVTESDPNEFRDIAGPDRSRTAMLIAGMPEDTFYVFEPQRPVTMTAKLESCLPGADVSSIREPAIFRVYRPVSQLAGACIVAEETRASILAPADRLRRKAGKIVAVSTSIALVFAYLIGFVLTRPIKVLQERVRRLKSGDYDSPVPVVGQGEVRDFSETFASMADSVRASRAALVESQQKLTMAYKAARLWLWSYDLKTGQISTQGPELEGKERAPKTLHAFLHSVHPHDRHMVCQALRSAKRTGLFEAEYRMETNGREAWIAGWGQVVHNKSGEPSALVGVSVDTTTRKSAQRLETDREKLMATSNLAASLAHEINNPLTSVIGSVYLASSRVEDDEVKHFLNIAGREAQRVAQIAKQMLALYRPTSMPEPVDVKRVMEVALGSVTPHAQRRGITVHADLDSMGTVVGFADEFRHAIMNLLMNAIEHSPSDATVMVRAHRSRSWQNNMTDRGVRVVVLNHGTALSREEIDKMFSPFVSTKAERGSGLGLWVTRAIVMKHGGRITVRSFSKPQEAVCCSMYLPARSALAN